MTNTENGAGVFSDASEKTEANFAVEFKAFTFDTREAAKAFEDALTDAFMAMAEADGIAATSQVVEQGEPSPEETQDTLDLLFLDGRVLKVPAPLDAYALGTAISETRKTVLDEEGIRRAGNLMAMAFWSELHERAGKGVLPEKLPAEAAEFLRQHMRDHFRATVGAGKLPKADALTVWYGSMPESNGRQNWTAVLYREGSRGMFLEGFCFARSEYPDRVRYEADRMRWVIGEMAERPDILAYDEKAHSGYVQSSPEQDALRPLAAIADAFDANELDDEARKFWGKNNEFQNTNDPDQIELFSGRGGKRLLTLADCMTARDVLSKIGGA